VVILVYFAYGFNILFEAIIRSRSLAAIWLILVLLILVVVGIVQLSLLIIRVGSLIASYVGVSPDTLEVYLWPLHHFGLRWEDVSLVSEPSESDGSTMLSLKAANDLAERSTPIWFRKVLRLFVRNEPRFLSLGTMQGYPHGDFADNLRRYAPHLFTAE
jgi:hypothetical protein